MVSCIRNEYKTVWDTFQDSALYLKIKEHTRVIKMDKKQLKLASAVLNAVRSTFPETNEFTYSTLKEECEKEGMTADEVIFCF